MSDLLYPRRIVAFFEAAAQAAVSKEDVRSFLIGAIGRRADGAMVRSLNGPTPHKNRTIHAEYKLSKKLDAGATVYIVRVRKDTGEFAMARPCDNCLKVLRSKFVKKIYYSISPSEYGIIDPANGNEKIYNIA